MEHNKVIRWGVLSTANIGCEKVIPAMHACTSSDVYAIASRDDTHAKCYAEKLSIEHSYGSYDELLADPNIDAIYNPLPNHLHVPWTLKAIAAGKHVLCEKPIALNATQAQQLNTALQAAPHIKVMEAFMYRFHPQWQKAKEIIDKGLLGAINHVDAHFSFFNADPANVRNQAGIGGGSLMDVGCYCISAARYLLAKEPNKVLACMINDAAFNVDKHCTGMLDFGSATASFNSSMQSQAAQHVYVYGEQGMLKLVSPFYQSTSQATQLILQQDDTTKTYEFAPCDQYANQIDAFAHAIKHQQSVPTPLSDAIANMHVIDALLQSHKQKLWIEIPSS